MFVKDEKPNFDVVTMCPPMIYGPPVHTMKLSDLNASTSRIYSSFINSKKDADLPTNGLHLYVDPRVSRQQHSSWQCKADPVLLGSRSSAHHSNLYARSRRKSFPALRRSGLQPEDLGHAAGSFPGTGGEDTHW